MNVRNRLWLALSAITLMALICTWSIAIGRYGGPDEPAHVLRAAAVANGQLYGDTAPTLPPGFRTVIVPATLASGDPICYRRDATKSASCAAAIRSPGTVTVATSAANYPPLYYAIIGLPTRWVGRSADAGTYRFFAAMFNAVVLWLALMRLRIFGRGAVTFLIAVTPAAWFLFGVVNPNGAEVALFALAWVGVARVHCAPRATREWMWVSGPVALAVAIRPVALAGLAAVAVVLIGHWQLGRRQLARVLAAPIIAIAFVGGWTWWAHLRLDDSRTAAHDSVSAATRHAIARLPTNLKQAISSMSWLELSAPWPVVAVWTALFGVVFVTVAKSRPDARWYAWLAVLVVTPVIFTALTRTQIGYVWQGRYSLPAFMGVGALALWHNRDVGKRYAQPLVCLFAVVEVGTFWVALRRYTVGTHGSWIFADHPGWSPALQPRLLLALNAALIAAFVVIVTSAHSTGLTSHVDSLRADDNRDQS